MVHHFRNVERVALSVLVWVFPLEKSNNLLQRKLLSTFKRNYSVFKHLKWKPRNKYLGKVTSFLMLPLPNETAGDNTGQVQLLSFPRAA